MAKIVGIYKITSPSGRVYIGQSIDIDNRFDDYKFPSNCKSQKKLYNSFIKYGTEKHTFSIIEECCIEQLNEKERFWQDFYEVITQKGLNCLLTKTKDKSGKRDEEFCKKISEIRKGKKASPETIEKLRKRMKGNSYTKNYIWSAEIIEKRRQGMIGKNKGKIHTQEFKNNLSKIKKGKPVYHIQKRVILNGVKEFESLTSAAKFFNIAISTIHNNIKGLSKKTKQGIWKYAN